MSTIEVRANRTARARNISPRLGAIQSALEAMREQGAPPMALLVIEQAPDNETFDLTAAWEEVS